ncbi:2-oxoglutarate and iron-dependent oxygenase domain-containing protein [Streptomyces sp. NPDC002746]
MGGAGTEASGREIRRIDLSDFDARKAEITEQLWAAATGIGFFQLVHHGIEQSTVERAFADAERFFALPEETKARHALKKGLNSGWESTTQVRPSIGRPDQKESYQLTRPHLLLTGAAPRAAAGTGFARPRSRRPSRPPRPSDPNAAAPCPTSRGSR